MEAYTVFVGFILMFAAICSVLGIYNILNPSVTTINVINKHDSFDENEKE